MARTNESPQQKMLKTICQQIQFYNARFGKSEASRLYICTEQERQIEGAKAMSYGEQYANDVASITLHQVFGYGETRQERFCDAFVRNYNYFRDRSYEDRADDPDAVYSKAEFEGLLKAAVGSKYVPPEERYKPEIFINGVQVE